MDSQKQQILERIKQANNILITVSANPSVDQLSACLGLTIMLNELGKHATAVFSGNVPSTIEFLQPEKTLEKNTDSLRDFIIALDKSKADKLRYKVEDKVVKIFITPYRTSISDKDLEFSQGDFNVEIVIALGVHDQQELDQAITAHGRILHDATVISVNTTPGNNLGTINWQDSKASSLAEMISSLAENFDKKVLDNQVATALLTGIVAETDRFSNNKTSPETMKASAMLMAAGANQQLVATKLQEPLAIPSAQPLEAAGQSNEAQPTEPQKQNDGTLQIEHSGGEPGQTPPESPVPPKQPPQEEPQQEPEEPKGPQIHIDETGNLHQLNEDREFLAGPGPVDSASAQMGLSGSDDEEKPSGAPNDNSKFVFNPPTLGGTLTANSQPEGLEPTTDPLSALMQGNGQPLLSHDESTPGTPSGPLVIEPPKHDDPEPVSSVTLPEPKLTVVPPEPAQHAGDEDKVSTLSSADQHDVDVQPVEPLPSNDAKPEVEESLPPQDEQGASPDLNSARDAVMSAINENGPDTTPNPITALNAQPLGGPLHQDNGMMSGQVDASTPLGNPNFNEAAPGALSPSDTPLDMPLPPTLNMPLPNTTPPTSSDNDNPSAPPPVPPPMMPFPPAGQ